MTDLPFQNAKKVACKAGHPFDAKNTKIDYRGHRSCRACENARKRLARQAKRGGQPILVRATPEELGRWVLSNVVPTESGCLIWQGRKFTPDGYGVVQSQKHLGMAHRLAYVAVKGEIPEGLTIDHLCMNTRCVNPDHMEPVTASENSKRAARARALRAKETP